MAENMNQEQRIDYLIESLKKDVPEYSRVRIPSDFEGKQRLLRCLMNVRDAKPAAAAVLSVQDIYLRGRALEKGIVNLREIETVRECLGSNHPFADSISIWQGDITRINADAIVNAANSSMLGCYIPMHNCIDNCIHTYAGIQLRAECARRMRSLRLRFGENYDQPTAIPMMTDAYNLPAKNVIHVVGPVVNDKLLTEHERKLAECYRNILDIACEYGLRSIAFCCISTGEFNFPNDKAAEIAVRTVTGWLSDNPGIMHRIIFNVFKDIDKECYENLLK